MNLKHRQSNALNIDSLTLSIIQTIGDKMSSAANVYSFNNGTKLKKYVGEKTIFFFSKMINETLLKYSYSEL